MGRRTSRQHARWSRHSFRKNSVSMFVALAVAVSIVAVILSNNVVTKNAVFFSWFAFNAKLDTIFTSMKSPKDVVIFNPSIEKQPLITGLDISQLGHRAFETAASNLMMGANKTLCLFGIITSNIIRVVEFRRNTILSRIHISTHESVIGRSGTTVLEHWRYTPAHNSCHSRFINTECLERSKKYESGITSYSIFSHAPVYTDLYGAKYYQAEGKDSLCDGCKSMGSKRIIFRECDEGDNEIHYNLLYSIAIVVVFVIVAFVGGVTGGVLFLDGKKVIGGAMFVVAMSGVPLSMGWASWNIAHGIECDSRGLYDRQVLLASQASNTATISDISQSLEVTPAAIAGVIFKV